MGFSHVRRVLQKSLIERSARSRAAACGAQLPPGELRVPTADEHRGQLFLLKRSEEFGPIFKVWMPHKMTTCIVGHELARRFLSENEQKIRAATPDLSPLFPFGFLRALEGDTHRKYRKLFVDAFKATPLTPHIPFIRQTVRDGLGRLAEMQQPIENTAIRKQLKLMTSRVSMCLMLGVSEDTPLFVPLLAAYDRYAPNGAFIAVRPRHKSAYRALRDIVINQVRVIKEDETHLPSLLAHFVRTDSLDDTVLGNLVHMVEVSRYDMHGLWSWILKHLGENPDAVALARQPTIGNAAMSAIQAIPRETLRMEQSELLLRVATEDIVFEGYFIPKASHVRICVWEAHHDPSIFSDPFHHDCTRFMNAKVRANDYSPFGMDHHRCLGADWAYSTSEIFVEEIVRGFDLQIIRDGAPDFGRFHYQPSKDFAIQLEARARAP